MVGMNSERLTVEEVGRYVIEHDSADSSLRVSWSGSQVFMNEQEARALLALLQKLYPYEDMARYEGDYSYLEGTDAAWHL
jgi:hypothetical protein